MLYLKEINYEDIEKEYLFVRDMSPACTQGLAKVMTDAKLSYNFIIIPQKQNCFRYKAIGEIFSFCECDHFRYCFFFKFIV